VLALSLQERTYAIFCAQLELGNMAKTGELKEMWDMAAKTNLQFNMVRGTASMPSCK